jgi:hypothetical protein
MLCVKPGDVADGGRRVITLRHVNVIVLVLLWMGCSVRRPAIGLRGCLGRVRWEKRVCWV